MGLVSKELNHFNRVIFRDWHWGHCQVAYKPLFMCHLSVSLVPNLGKTTQSPQNDLTSWILTLDETVEQLDSVRRENKNLADEIKDLLDQLGEGGRSIHELDKQRRRLQVSFFFAKEYF